VTARHRLVVFDCDGTLVDSQRLIVDCVQEVFAGEGLAVPTAEAIRRIVGLSLVEAVDRLMGGADPAHAAVVAERYKDVFMRRRLAGPVEEPLFPGARELLETLQERGLLLGIATGKAMRGLRHVLATHRLETRFVTLQTADRHPSKPHPAMLRAAMAETGARSEETVLVGDTTFDIEMARAAGALPVGVAWGNHPPDELHRAGAVAVLERFDGLLRLLR
jgi:phosphoglycolate phosphatase